METEQKIEEVPQADQASDEPLSSGEEEEEKKEKKEKKKSKKRKEKGSGSEDEGSASGEEQEKKKSKKNKPEKQKNDQGEVFFDLGMKKRVTIREWKGKTLVDIREYYEDKNGEMKPGKKGISLNAEQWKKVADLAHSINRQVKKM